MLCAYMFRVTSPYRSEHVIGCHAGMPETRALRDCVTFFFLFIIIIIIFYFFSERKK